MKKTPNVKRRRPIQVTVHDVNNPRTSHAVLGDGTTWPIPAARLAEVERRLRYAHTELRIQDAMVAASTMAAYRALINATQARRNQVAAALRDARDLVRAEDTDQ